jgi:hypothetical protein
MCLCRAESNPESNGRSMCEKAFSRLHEDQSQLPHSSPGPAPVVITYLESI